MRTVVWLLLCGVILGSSSCDSGLPPPPTIESLDAWRAYSDALEPRLARLSARDSTWEMGDASSVYTVRLAEGGVLAVHEDMSLGDYGERRLHYYFRAGFLRYMREEGRILAGGGGTVELRSLQREVLYATDGQVLASLNRVGGADVHLDAAVAAGAREHALELVSVDAAGPPE